jgi:hypothetical protein
MGQMTAGGIAMQNLSQEALYGGDGREHPVAPAGVTSLLARGDAGLRLSLGRPFHLKSLEHGGDAGNHPSTSCMRV